MHNIFHGHCESPYMYLADKHYLAHSAMLLAYRSAAGENKGPKIFNHSPKRSVAKLATEF